MSLIKYQEDNTEILIPENPADLQDLAEKLWEKIFEQEKPDATLIKTYNKIAEIQNKQIGWT